MKAVEYEKPLVEKYRPVTLKDVVGNCLAVDQLKAIAEKGNLPNIIVVVRNLLLFEIPAIFLLKISGSSRNR